MKYHSKVTGKYYDVYDVVFIGNIIQAGAYIYAGAGDCLIDVLYDKSKSKNKLTFVFEKNERTKELFKLWNDYKLEY